MENTDEFKTNEFLVNDDKNWTVKYAHDKLSKKMEVSLQKSRIHKLTQSNS